VGDPYMGHGDGWRSISEPLIALCKERGVEIRQIKEKFGGLRFYVGSAPDEVHVAIEAAENLSFLTCENCGAPGSLDTSKAWIRTLCEKCASQR
jgi:hypothetical protein